MFILSNATYYDKYTYNKQKGNKKTDVEKKNT